MQCNDGGCTRSRDASNKAEVPARISCIQGPNNKSTLRTGICYDFLREVPSHWANYDYELNQISRFIYLRFLNQLKVNLWIFHMILSRMEQELTESVK
jgi:hypothetical protein